MQLSLLVAALAAFATGALAGLAGRSTEIAENNCTPLLHYCGQTLLNIGKYQAQIDQALSDAGKIEINNGKEDLFYCVGGNNGLIKWQQHCGNGCKDAGTGNSDYCD